MSGYLQRLILRGAGAAPRSALQSPPPVPIAGSKRWPEVAVEGVIAAPPLAPDPFLEVDAAAPATRVVAAPQPSEPQRVGSIPRPAVGTDQQVDPVNLSVPKPRVFSPAPAVPTHQTPPRRAAPRDPESAPRPMGTAPEQERASVAPAGPVSAPAPARASSGYATLTPGERPRKGLAVGPVARPDHVARTVQVPAPGARSADPTAVNPAAAAATLVQVAPRGARSPAAAQPLEMPDIPARGPAEAPPFAAPPPETPAVPTHGLMEPLPVPARPPAMPRPQPLPRQRRAAARTAPAVSVRIGRVEVRSVPASEPAPSPAAAPRSAGAQGFDTYLALRNYTRRDY